MNMEVNGNDSRVAGRDFKEGGVHIDRYEDSKTIYINGSNDNKKLLVSAQRKILNELVQKVSAVCHEKKSVIWLQIYAESGVNNINEITIEQYPLIINYLNKIIDEKKEEMNKSFLVHLLLKNTQNDEGLRDELRVYCQLKFAMKNLFNELNCSQLRQALEWLYEKKQEKKLSQNVNWFDLFRKYPKHFVTVILISLFIGLIIF
ncbi:hypothetical protein [Arsenophonus apicola]|uniref:Uncharacterized protein n=1 Tax=Arsenophonus apicola TaxID=2879119 RepID=A0ABY8P5D8_9GAMM|nr:hypothetical protein [Arsenophonus apicola]WGO84702.1 hypothetical protein QG404_07520 [Arsenophonus apicola]